MLTRSQRSWLYTANRAHLPRIGRTVGHCAPGSHISDVSAETSASNSLCASVLDVKTSC